MFKQCLQEGGDCKEETKKKVTVHVNVCRKIPKHGLEGGDDITGGG